jgi:tetratricopeptide (TPR) repeat protein
MSISAAELVRQTDDRLRDHLHIDAGLSAASAVLADETLSLRDRVAESQRLLIERWQALEEAGQDVGRLSRDLEHLSQALPFLPEAWPEQRDALRRAISETPDDWEKGWLCYWFTAASRYRIEALNRLHSDVPLPATASPLVKRMPAVTKALADGDWHQCHQVLELGLDKVKDRRASEDLNLLITRLALKNQVFDQADAVIDRNDPKQCSAPWLALRARSAELRGDSKVSASLLRQARDTDPRDLDVCLASVILTYGRQDLEVTLLDARAAVGSLPSLADVDGDVGRLVQVPAELWIAVADRAHDEGHDLAAAGYLARAAKREKAARLRKDVMAAIEERRSDIVTPPAEKRQALITAGEWRSDADQLDRARLDYEAAAAGKPAGAAEARIQASAQLHLADLVAVLAQERPYLDMTGELEAALAQLTAARERADEWWSHLTESELRVQLSMSPGTDPRTQRWLALHAAARAVSLRPLSAAAWLTLARAAHATELYWVSSTAAERAAGLTEAEEAVRFSILALVHIGRYAEARHRLGDARDPWSQCMRGYIATELGDPGEAIEHFGTVSIGPTWTWAWHAYVSAQVIAGDLVTAQATALKFLEASAGQTSDREALSIAAFTARVQGRLDDARKLAQRLRDTAPAGDIESLRVMGETLVLAGQEEGWDMLAQALRESQQPTAVYQWQHRDRPMLQALAKGVGVKADFSRLAPVVDSILDRGGDVDPVAEIRRAALALEAPAVAAEAAQLIESVLQAGRS